MVSAACVLKVLVFRAQWPLQMKAVGFLETVGCVKLFVFFHFFSLFLPQFCFSRRFAILFYHCFSYPLLLMSSLRFALFISISFSLLYLSVLYLLYPFTFVIFFLFLNVIFLIEFCRAARDLKSCRDFSCLCLHYIVWECTQFMWFMSHWINSLFQVILNHSPLNVSSPNSKKW